MATIWIIMIVIIKLVGGLRAVHSDHTIQRKALQFEHPYCKKRKLKRNRFNTGNDDNWFHTFFNSKNPLR